VTNLLHQVCAGLHLYQLVVVQGQPELHQHGLGEAGGTDGYDRLER